MPRHAGRTDDKERAVVDFVEAWLKPQLIVMLLAAIATFVTVLTIALPVLSRDRMGQRMKVMATEREKMRASRLTELSKDGQGRLLCVLHARR